MKRSAERIGEPRWRPPAPQSPDAGPSLVRMRDGVGLATDVYLPRPLGERVPAVLMRTCYDKSGPDLDAPRLAEQLGERGYALVVQDVRGHARSEGERTPWLNEAADAFDTIDWLVRQSWCDERVAMMGESYLGFTQWAAVASAHPGLRVIAPRVASQRVPDGWFASDVASASGADWLARWWSGSGRLELDGLDWTARPFVEAIGADLPNARRLHREFLSLNDAELHAAVYPGPPPASRIAIPALHTGAWFDPLGACQLRDWGLVSSRSPAAGDQFLVLAAQDHVGRPITGTGADARTRHVTQVLDFFDHYLRGRRRAGSWPRVRYEIAGAGWRTADRWPPPGIAEQRLFLGRDATLDERPAATGELTWEHDPADPVPATFGAGDDLLTRGGTQPVPSETDVHRRPDVLIFTAEPAPAPLDLVGPVALDVVVASTAPSTHLVATLCDVTSDGAATPLLEGIARVDTRYGSCSTTVHLGSTGYRLAAGHRLRLVVAASRYPRYLVHPGTDDNLWTAVAARPARLRVGVGGEGGSRLRLSVLPRRAPGSASAPAPDRDG